MSGTLSIRDSPAIYEFMEKNLYKTAKKHKFVKALKAHIESKGESFEEYLYFRYIKRIGARTLKGNDMKKQAAVIETIALYMMATHASKEKLEKMYEYLIKEKKLVKKL